MKKVYTLLLCLSLLLSIAGCGSMKTSGSKGISGFSGRANEIKVFAAASLTESMSELSKEYEKYKNGSIKIVLNFGGSQSLKTAVENGAEADIFISANVDYMNELKDKGFIDMSGILLKNRLVLIENRNSPFVIKNMGDLCTRGLKIAVGDSSVPVGMYWEKAFDKAFKDGLITEVEKDKIEKNIKTRELNVKDIVSKVLFNEVDAGIVYRTDFTRQIENRLKLINFKLFEEFDAVYPAAVLKSSGSSEFVKEFYEYLFSNRAKEIFSSYGFIE